MRLLQDVNEEGAVRVRITAEQDDVATIDHVSEATRRKDAPERTPASVT
jgi:hypothetical protein